MKNGGILMINVFGNLLRVVLEFVLFVGIYYFLMTRWQNQPQKETFKKSIIMGLIWVVVYEIIMYIMT